MKGADFEGDARQRGAKQLARGFLGGDLAQARLENLADEGCGISSMTTIARGRAGGSATPDWT